MNTGGDRAAKRARIRMWRRCFSQPAVQWTRALAAALVGTAVPAALAYAVEPAFKVEGTSQNVSGVRLSSGAGTFGAAKVGSDASRGSNVSAPGDGRTPAPLALPAESSQSAWERAFTIKAGVGYKDNLTLAPDSRESSPFVASVLEAFALRRSKSGHQLMALATVEDARYWSGRTVDHEDLAIAQGEWRRFWANDWQAALGLEGIYLDQVIDLSVTETNREALPIRGWTLTARPGVRRELSAQTWLTLELPVTRQLHEATIDDFLELGPKVILGHHLNARIEANLTYAFTHRDYDEEPARDAAGDTVTNTVRGVAQHDLAGVWKHYWDGARRWRSVTKLGYRHSSDNLSGYFDYERYSVSQDVRFQTSAWEIAVEARLAQYRYPVQTVSDTDRRKRKRTDLTLGLRAERQLIQHVRLYAQYEYERSDSNSALDEYAVNTVSGGVAVEF
jgi:opacity protein-like surface antigen